MSDMAEAQKEKARRLGRSPAYPTLPVQKALGQAKALYDQEKEYAAPLASALKAWGYSEKSSGGRQTLATMKYYGLVDIIGEGDGRRVKVSATALKILRDPREDETEKRALIRRVALAPAAHKLLFEEWRTGLASDGSALHFLMENGFNDKAARELLTEFKETASFAGLYDPQKSVDKPSAKADSEEAEDPPTIRVGDKVQWVVNGAEQFEGGANVEAIHAGGEWLWVSEELCKSGIPMGQVELIERGTGEANTAPPRPKTEAKPAAENQTPELGKPKVTIEGDVMTIIASVPMSELGSLKKKIEGLEIFYNA